MHVQFDDLDFYVWQETPANADPESADKFEPGYYWHEARLPPVGPFATPLAALRDMVDRIECDDLPAKRERRA